jgi:thioredoxin-dependent peroxiredoxin
MEHTNPLGVTLLPEKIPRGDDVTADRSLRPGDKAPDFALATLTGKSVGLSDFLGRTELVLFFYPKDNSAVCSAEACSFRDQYQDFCDAGATVVGISSDSADSHRRFAERLKLPFILLSDPGGSVRKRYRVPRTLGLIPGRTTFLIDRNGIIQRVFSSQFQPAKHVSEALDALRKLRQ